VGRTLEAQSSCSVCRARIVVLPPDVRLELADANRDLVHRSPSFAEQFSDFRRKRINDKEYFDTINFYIKWASNNTMVIERDNPPMAIKTREALYASKVKFTEEELKNPKGFVTGAKFILPAVVITDVQIKADHDQGRLVMQTKNLLGLGPDTFSLPAPEINDALLEEFGKALIGQPNNFRRFRGVAPAPR